jgi:hypothetical protein
MTIKFYDAKGTLVGEVEASNARRFSMQAAANHKKMDKFKAAHEEVVRAELPQFSFRFDVYGISRVVD